MAKSKKVVKKKTVAKKKVIRKKKTKKRPVNTQRQARPSNVTHNKAQSSPSQEELAFHNLSTIIRTALRPEGTWEEQQKAEQAVRQYLSQIFSKHPISTNYNILIIHDEGLMIRSDIDKIYRAVTTFEKGKPILLVLYSTGGHIGPAYLIGKLCREYAVGKLVIVVPRQAKSAATLLCCAADELHMGSLSEIGPIDPQIDNLPALGLKSSVEHLSEMVKDYPAASNMFAKYLSASLPLINLGYYERVAESAMQYATRLLEPHKQELVSTPEEIAKSLVYSYKDHGFVIDKNESQIIFGKKMVKTANTAEYKLGNNIYSILVRISRIADRLGYSFYLVGSSLSRPIF